MNFASYFPTLEAHAEKKIGDGAAGMTTTKEIASAIGVRADEAVGAYEAYNREPKRRFEFEREFSRDYERFDWHVTIKKL